MSYEYVHKPATLKMLTETDIDDFDSALERFVARVTAPEQYEDHKMYALWSSVERPRL